MGSHVVIKVKVIKVKKKMENSFFSSIYIIINKYLLLYILPHFLSSKKLNDLNDHDLLDHNSL